MYLTKEEKDHGLMFIADMTFQDYIKVIEAKIDELDKKAEVYLAACEADIRLWKNMTPHQLNVLIDLHKAYIEGTRATLHDLKEMATKNLHKDYMVPSLMIETFVDLARKISTIAYIKLPNSHARIP